jgi:hypothetical protein
MYTVWAFGRNKEIQAELLKMGLAPVLCPTRGKMRPVITLVQLDSWAPWLAVARRAGYQVQCF